MKRIVICLGLSLWAQGAVAQSCSEIRFAPGASSGVLSGQVRDGQPMCYTFATGAGQIAQLQLSGSDNTCFTITDVIDCQDDFSFRTRQGRYEVTVFQLFRTGGAEQFSLEIAIR